MTIKTIAVEQLFPTGIYANLRLRAEASIDEPYDNVEKCYELLHEKINDAFKKLNPEQDFPNENPISQSPLPETKIDPKEQRIKALIDTINMCSTVKNLKMFEAQVYQHDNQEVITAFESKLKQLQ